MEKNKEFQILLSTYNGEKYIREQLDSYVKQTVYDNIKVLIRDDGSTDGTINILREYEQKYGFEIIEGENIGVNNSIFELLKRCDKTCKYFAISDQDDVWLDNKLAIAQEKLSELNEGNPILFATCSQIVDSNLRPLGSSIIPYKGISFYNAMIQNVTPGHTQVLNRELVIEIINKGIDNVPLIDFWFFLVATGIGKVVFDNTFTVLHRQHGDNSIGYELRFFRSTIQRLKRIIRNKNNNITIQIRLLIDRFGSQLNDDYIKELQRFLQCQNTLIRRFIYILTCNVYRQTTYETLVFKILYLLGKYRVKC